MSFHSWVDAVMILLGLGLVWSSNRYLIRAIRYNSEAGRPRFAAAELGFTGLLGGFALMAFALSALVGSACG
jgi:hypothetical protein